MCKAAHARGSLTAVSSTAKSVVICLFMAQNQRICDEAPIEKMLSHGALTTRCGCRVTAAILVMEMLLVLLASVASGCTICAGACPFNVTVHTWFVCMITCMAHELQLLHQARMRGQHTIAEDQHRFKVLDRATGQALCRELGHEGEACLVQEQEGGLLGGLTLIDGLDDKVCFT